MNPFFQTPPAIGNQFDDDRVLRSYLARRLDPAVRDAIEPSLREMGELAGGPLYRRQLEDRLNEPVLVPYDAWGKRIDHIELTPLWKEAREIAFQHGVVATAYEKKHGPDSRVHQFALAYLFDASTDVYTCPLAMTDGAAKTLSVHASPALRERALARLTSRDPAFAWTSGQWMTERTGGSDVGLSQTEARQEPNDPEGRYRLYGTKWFTSATTSEMALALGRPEGNPAGSKGLALFYVEMWNERGERNEIWINRLKDKLGTRKVPTAELTLSGALATPVHGTTDGVRHIAPMLNITRTWNAVGAIAGLRRGLALARDYAKKRVQFGAPLSDKALHVDTLAGVQAEFEGAFHLAFRAIELIGREEAASLDEDEQRLLRLVTPIAKLLTAKQAVAGLSELIESFGGAGYIEDTGLPRLLRDAQVLPIWEGTTNVLSLDTLRALGGGTALASLEREVAALGEGLRDAELARCSRAAKDALAHAIHWVAATAGKDPLAVEAGARRFALTLGRAWSLALLARHADWSLATERDGRARYAALRYLANGIDFVRDDPHDEAARALASASALANDAPLA